MRERLFIRIDPADVQRASWVRVAPQQDDDTPRTFQVQHGALAEAAEEAHGCEVIVLVPGSDVVLLRASIPSRQRQQILKAVPYALEEQLAGDIEQLHFALGERDAQGSLYVAVVSRARMQQWRDALEQAGIEAAVMLPDWQVLPLHEHSWVIFEDRHTALVRTGAQQGFTVDTENLPVVLGALLAEQQEAGPERLLLLGSRHEALRAELAQAGIALPAETLSDQRALGEMVSGYQPRRSINLAQGDFSRREQLGRLLRPWRLTAVLAVAWLLVSLALKVGDHVRLSRAAEQTTARIEQIYRDTFPEAKRVVDPRAQMAQQLSALRGAGAGGDSGFLAMLAAASETLTQTPGATLERLAFRGGRLDLALTMPSLQALEQLKQRLIDSSGLAVKIESASARGSQVEARLSIRQEEGA